MSRMQVFGAIEPNVTMCETWSAPYLLATYSITRPRPSSSKSSSMSGIEMRSGLRKRSKSRWCGMGSMSVMPRQ